MDIRRHSHSTDNAEGFCVTSIPLREIIIILGGLMVNIDVVDIEPGAQIPGHYHKEQHHYILCLRGIVTVITEVPDTISYPQQTILVPLENNKRTGLFIPSGFAHSFYAVMQPATLLVYSNAPSDEADRFPHELNLTPA